MNNESEELAPTEASQEDVAATEAPEAENAAPEEAEHSTGESPVPEDNDAEERAARNRAQREAKKARRLKEREELEQLRAQRAALKAAKTEEPNESDFDDYEDYRLAKAIHSHSSAQTASQEKQLTAKETELEGQLKAQKAAEFGQQMEQARGRYQDFDAVVFNPNAPISPDVANIISESEVGADLAYFLGSNPETAREISSLSPIEAARHLGRIEATLTAPQPKTETTAPKPIAPVSGGMSAGKDPEKMTMPEYRKYREAGGQ